MVGLAHRRFVRLVFSAFVWHNQSGHFHPMGHQGNGSPGSHIPIWQWLVPALFQGKYLKSHLPKPVGGIFQSMPCQCPFPWPLAADTVLQVRRFPVAIPWLEIYLLRPKYLPHLLQSNTLNPEPGIIGTKYL